MQTRPVALVIADISGYTRFVRMHRLSQAHAEHIVCELLEAVIARTEYPWSCTNYSATQPSSTR